MKPVDDKKEEEKLAESEKKPVPLTPVAEIKANVALIERAVSTLEPRFTHRVLRSLAQLRKKLDDKVLQDAVQDVYTTGTYFAFLTIWLFGLYGRVQDDSGKPTVQCTQSLPQVNMSRKPACETCLSLSLHWHFAGST